jgi:hypothetical protein
MSVLTFSPGCCQTFLSLLTLYWTILYSSLLYSNVLQFPGSNYQPCYYQCSWEVNISFGAKSREPRQSCVVSNSFDTNNGRSTDLWFCWSAGLFLWVFGFKQVCFYTLVHILSFVQVLVFKKKSNANLQLCIKFCLFVIDQYSLTMRDSMGSGVIQ